MRHSGWITTLWVTLFCRRWTDPRRHGRIAGRWKNRTGPEAGVRIRWTCSVHALKECASRLIGAFPLPLSAPVPLMPPVLQVNEQIPRQLDSVCFGLDASGAAWDGVSVAWAQG